MIGDTCFVDFVCSVLCVVLCLLCRVCCFLYCLLGVGCWYVRCWRSTVGCGLLVFGYCALFGVRCVPLVVCGLLQVCLYALVVVVCCLVCLFVVCWCSLLVVGLCCFVVCYGLRVFCLSRVVSHSSNVVRCLLLLFVVCRVLFVGLNVL